MRRWIIAVDLPAISDTQQQLAAHLDALGIEARASFVLNLVFEETARNLVDHAADGRAVTFEVRVVHVVYATTITIEDSFAPFDPTDAPLEPLPTSLQEHTGRGLGIRLMSDLADDLRYDRMGERNRLSATVLHR